MKKLCSLIDSLSSLFFSAAWFFTLLLVFLVVQQVVSRYFFDASSIGLQELEWHLFGFIICLSMAYTLKENGHVRVDVLSTHFPGRVRRLINGAGMLLVIPLALSLAWFGFKDAAAAREFVSPTAKDYYSALLFGGEGVIYNGSAWIEGLLRKTVLVGEGSPNPGGLEARWIIKAAIPLGMLLLALQAFAEFLRSMSSSE